MEVFASNITIFQCCGFWRPKSDSSCNLKRLYRAYTCLIVMFSQGMCIFKVINLLTSEINSLDEFSNKTLLLPEILCSYMKGINIYLQQMKIERMFAIFNNFYCRPKDAVEWKIQMAYNKECK